MRVLCVPVLLVLSVASCATPREVPAVVTPTSPAPGFPASLGLDGHPIATPFVVIDIGSASDATTNWPVLHFVADRTHDFVVTGAEWSLCAWDSGPADCHFVDQTPFDALVPFEQAPTIARIDGRLMNLGGFHEAMTALRGPGVVAESAPSASALERHTFAADAPGGAVQPCGHPYELAAARQIVRGLLAGDTREASNR